MKKHFIITISFFLAVLASISGFAQSSDCNTLDGNQKKLFLNGNNFTLIDNALRCFKLNSIEEQKDSLIRIWILEDDFPDTPTTWRVKMFEFGKKGDVPIAKMHLLEWTRGNESTDSSFPVKCIKQTSMSPERGWVTFEKDIRRLNLEVLYKKPLINDGFVIVDYGMLIIQFLFGHTTYTVDFTGLVDLFNPKNSLQYDHSKRITYLFWCIEKYFSIRLSVDSKGRDFLEPAMTQLNLRTKAIHFDNKK